MQNAEPTPLTDAKAKAEREYEHYRKLLDAQPQRIDAEFERAAKELKKLPQPKRPRKPKHERPG